MHMPRALRHYQEQSISVIPLPSDFVTSGPEEGWSPRLLIPRGAAMGLSDSAAKEWIGRLSQRFR
jgi:hypothetical protein